MAIIDEPLLEMPEVSDEIEEEIRGCFQNYIFYSNDNRNHRHGWCTRCGNFIDAERGLETHQNGIRHEFFHATHNDPGTCPYCNTKIIYKSEGKAKKCKNLYEMKRFLIIQPDGHDRVYMNAMYIETDFTDTEQERPELWCRSRRRYLLTPEGAVMDKPNDYWYDTYYKTSDGRRHLGGSWMRADHPTEPFQPYMWYGQDYFTIGLNDLAGTFLQYSQVDEIACRGQAWADKIATYLCQFCTKPQMEFLVKADIMWPVSDLIGEKKEHRRDLDWSASKPADFFRLSKERAKEYLASKQLRSSLLLFHKYGKKTNLRFEDLDKLRGHVREDWEAEEILKTALAGGFSLKTVANRIDAIGVRRLDWFDYMRAAKELNYDLTRLDVVFPKDLAAAHNAATAAVKIKHNKEAEKKYQPRRKKLVKRYELRLGNYCMLIPEGIDDVIREGKLQQHCVAGYAERHVKGVTTILFLRDKRNIEAPLYTLEVDDKDHGRVRQIRGFRNKSVTKPDVQEFFEIWKAWVAAGSPRNEEGEPEIVMEEKEVVA